MLDDCFLDSSQEFAEVDILRKSTGMSWRQFEVIIEAAWNRRQARLDILNDSPTQSKPKI